jgi:dihydroorotase
MDILIKNATILHKGSVYHLQQKDIFIDQGKIQRIGDHFSEENVTRIIKGTHLYCCIGLCDIGTHCGEPGYEHQETIHSLSTSALVGGYTALAVFPNLKPVTQTRADIQFLAHHRDRQGVSLFPIGALSKDLKGIDIAEFMDMATSGAIAFSDGIKPIQDTGLLSRALLYALQSKSIIIHHPDDQYLSAGGEMHEGNMSTSLGMKGVPDIAELFMVQRDILLNEYNTSTLIEHAISSAASVSALKVAKKRQTGLFATVAYHNLIFTDADLHNFDTNYKLSPVLRSSDDKSALIQGLKEDTLDVIISNHTPLDEENKVLEFPYALSGASGLETCLSACIDYLKSEIDIADIVYKMTVAPRKILGLTIPEIDKDADVNLCIFDVNHPWELLQKDIQSKSKNNPFIGHRFNTKVIATLI